MPELFFEFWSLSDPNVVWVLCGAILLGAGAGTIGSFAFLRKRSLTGDVLAHAALPGVTTAFMLFQSRDPLIILGGAVVSCLIGYLTIEYLIHNTRIKEDSAFAIVLSLFFAVGVMQLTGIQKSGAASQAGLDKLLFGQAAGLVRNDVILLGTIAAGLILMVALFFRQFKAVSFDRQFAATAGLSVRFYELLLALALVLSVVIGLQLVGVVLMAAILLTPPAAARYWTDDLALMLFLSAVFGALAGVAGVNISYLAPRMPTGPWMVMGISVIFVLSLLFAPKRGMISRFRRYIKLSRRVNEENVLRTIYKIGESQDDMKTAVDGGMILNYRNMHVRDMEAALSRLVRKNMLLKDGAKYTLSGRGLARAGEVTRFHRLWELYLTRRINVAEDHVHDEAEDIEHILTPELEARLLAELDSPLTDPHGKSIPVPGEGGGGS